MSDLRTGVWAGLRSFLPSFAWGAALLVGYPKAVAWFDLGDSIGIRLLLILLWLPALPWARTFGSRVRQAVEDAQDSMNSSLPSPARPQPDPLAVEIPDDLSGMDD